MTFGTAVILWMFLVFVLEWDAFWTGLVLYLVVSSSAIDINKLTSPKVERTPVAVVNFGNVQREYIDISIRSDTVVEVVKINGEMLACITTDNCFNPTIKKHNNGVLYACSDKLCYEVK